MYYPMRYIVSMNANNILMALCFSVPYLSSYLYLHSFSSIWNPLTVFEQLSLFSQKRKGMIYLS